MLPSAADSVSMNQKSIEQKSIMPIAEAHEITGSGPPMLEPVELWPLFACGGLEDPDFVSQLLERPVEAEPARLPGYAIAELPGTGSTVLFPSPEHVATGKLYRGLKGEDYARLDAYTGALEGLYRRETVEVVAGGDDEADGPTEKAYAYLPTDRTLGRYA